MRLNASIASIPLPDRMRHLPVSDTGYPIPWFVADIGGGVRDFRIADPAKFVRAVKKDLCWLCGNTLGRFKCFVIGPMCAVNRTTAEPPCHRDCAEYSAMACPFLSRPRMRRNDADLPEHQNPGGIMIRRNPGCILVWITHDYRIIKSDGGVIIKLGDPVELLAYAEGQRTGREALDASILTGLPLLSEVAAQDGEDALRALADQMRAADKMIAAKLTLPAPVAP